MIIGYSLMIGKSLIENEEEVIIGRWGLGSVWLDN